MLLDEHSCPAALLKPLLFVVASELALDQDGRLRHLLIESKLGVGRRGGLNWRDRNQTPEGHPKFSWCRSLSLIHTLVERPESPQTTSHPDLMPNTLSAIQVSLWREKGVRVPAAFWMLWVGVVGEALERAGTHLFVLPVTALDHSCCYLLLLLQPPALRGKQEVSAPKGPPNRPVICPSNFPEVPWPSAQGHFG